MWSPHRGCRLSSAGATCRLNPLSCTAASGKLTSGSGLLAVCSLLAAGLGSCTSILCRLLRLGLLLLCLHTYAMLSMGLPSQTARQPAHAGESSTACSPLPHGLPGQDPFAQQAVLRTVCGGGRATAPACPQRMLTFQVRLWQGACAAQEGERQAACPPVQAIVRQGAAAQRASRASTCLSAEEAEVSGASVAGRLRCSGAAPRRGSLLGLLDFCCRGCLFSEASGACTASRAVGGR